MMETANVFTDVTRSAGVQLSGSFRQMSWVDYDNDGDVDLFVALRDKPNVLFRNDNGKFTDTAETLGVADPRRTVGAAWFDFDKDGDLDLYVTNMDGDANGLFRNDGSRLSMLPAKWVSTRAAGPWECRVMEVSDRAWPTLTTTAISTFSLPTMDPMGSTKTMNGTEFINVAPKLGLAIDARYDTGTWGDYNHDGHLDLYVNGTVSRGKNYRDYLFQNDGERFIDVTPENLAEQEADHGAHWADCDNDGDLDLALTGAGMHYIFENLLPIENARRSLQVMVLDAQGRYTLAGSEVRLYEAGTKTLLGMNILDTGSGYNSQNAMPVHFGLPAGGAVDVEITTLTANGRKTATVSNIAPKDYIGNWLIIKMDRKTGTVTK